MDEITAAIAAFIKDASREHLQDVLESMKRAMKAGEMILVPVEDGTAQRMTTTRADGTIAMVMYSGEEEASRSEGTVVSVELTAFLREVLKREEISGVEINPEGTRMFLPKAMIQTMLFEEQPQENEIFFEIGDITELECDCIVNAANSSLLRGGGVCGAIFRAAGWELDDACDAIGHCATGEAVITKGFQLKAPYIIHTVGPVYSGKKEDAALLASCYRKSLDLAMANEIHSIAFPAISTGIYGYPLEEACEIALVSVSNWLADHLDYGMAVIFSCFDQTTYNAYEKCINRIEGKETETC
ncbi:MAG: macro domain-containing protein [Lachnospiraceae bacterium]|nr:macro domain-containing protein [Lachnospiraceae bacterium]